MLAHPYGRPRIMSSFDFDNSEQGPPTTPVGTTRPVRERLPAGFLRLNCFLNDWKCEHRWPAIAAMVAFRRQVAGAPLVHWWDNGRDGLAFGRGDRGFVAINRASDRTLVRTLQTDLPPGKYCNIIRHEFDPTAGTCSGPTYLVDRLGRVELRIEPLGAAALHLEARAPMMANSVAISAEAAKKASLPCYTSKSANATGTEWPLQEPTS